MTNRRRSATTRSVPAQTPEQLLEQAQEHIRPLIGVIDRLNEADAEDQLRVINKQVTRLGFRVQPLPPRKARKSRPAERPRRPQHLAAGCASDRAQSPPARGVIERTAGRSVRNLWLARLFDRPEPSPQGPS